MSQRPFSPTTQSVIADTQAASLGDYLVQTKIDKLTIPSTDYGTLDPNAGTLATERGKSALRRAAAFHLQDYYQALNPAGRCQANSIFARSDGSLRFLGKSRTTGCVHFSLTSRSPAVNDANETARPSIPGSYSSYWGFDGYNSFRTNPTERRPRNIGLAPNPTAPTRSRLSQVQNADDLS